MAAADRLGIADRGIIRSGACADVVVLDLDAIRETATWTQPCQLATGMHGVWINGERVVRAGKLGDARPGGVLRRGATQVAALCLPLTMLISGPEVALSAWRWTGLGLHAADVIVIVELWSCAGAKLNDGQTLTG